jgi:hypothetical protein
MEVVDVKKKFDELTKLEPRFAELVKDVLDYVRRTKRRRQFCANAPWYGYRTQDGGFRRRVHDLVGMARLRDGSHPALATDEAFRVVHMHIYWNLLPACRHDGRDCG